MDPAADQQIVAIYVFEERIVACVGRVACVACAGLLWYYHVRYKEGVGEQSRADDAACLEVSRGVACCGG